jgi:hypothetical protein
MSGEERHTLSQEDIDMLQNRRQLDAKFEEFMAKSIEDRAGIRGKVDQLELAVADNTRTTNAIHTALFARSDDNEFGMTGLMTNMQTVLKHTEVVCNFAKFAKWSIVGLGGLAAAVLPVGKLLGWWTL